MGTLDLIDTGIENDQSDAELIARNLGNFQTEQGGADFNTIMTRNARWMRYWVKGKFRVQDADAEDILQESMLAAWKGIDTLKTPDAFYTWMCVILFNVGANMLRKRNRVDTHERTIADTNLEGLYFGVACDDPQIAERARVEQLQILRRVYNEIDQLDPIFREPMQRFHVAGEILREIAVAMNIPMGTVKRRLHDARLRVREAIEESTDNPQ